MIWSARLPTNVPETQDMTPRNPILTAALCSGLMVVPMLAFGQTAAPRAPTEAPAAAGTTAPGAQSPAARQAMPTQAGPDTRASEIIGANVYNRQGEAIGSIDDLIIERPMGPPGRGLLGGAGPGQRGAGQPATGPMGAGQGGITAVLSVGTFLGMGGRLVLVPLSELQYDRAETRWVHPSATRQQLEALPPFTFERGN
jgi:hypothetical protein